MTDAEAATRRLMDEAAREDTHNVRQSPWVRNAQRAALPYKVHADMRTDVRTHVVRETMADIIRRTMPPSGGEVE